MIKRIIAAFAIIILLTACVQAQNKEQTAVATLVEQLKKAMIDADSSALATLVSAELSYGHSSGAIENKTEFIKKIISGQSNFEVMDLTEQTVSISGDVAVVRHILTAKVIDNGKPNDVHLRILMVWQKQKGKWKLLARQGVKIV